MQIRDSDWADPGEIVSPDDTKEGRRKGPSTRRTSLRAARGLASRSSHDGEPATALEPASEEIDDLVDDADEPKPRTD